MISGRSNGGLLVGNTNSKSKLLWCSTASSGCHGYDWVTEFTEGWGWRGDYGYPILAKDFHRNIEISPYHQTKIGVCYSPTLTTTARRDDRVVPSHSYKFTARQQEYQAATIL